MHTIRAKFDGSNFTPLQPIPIKEKCDVIITFLEPVRKEEKLPCSSALGLWKGNVKMADDFNEPLDEMMEYME